MNKTRSDQIEALVRDIHGWLISPAGQNLYEIASGNTEKGIVVELGVWKGLSAAWLGFGLKDKKSVAKDAACKLYCVDTWQGSDEEQHKAMLENYGPQQLYREFLENMERLGLSEVIEPVRSTTIEAAEAWDKGVCIEVLHIDAGHEYESVRADFEHWSCYVVSGGLIIFDDVPTWHGPTRVVSELPRWYPLEGVIPNKWVVRKA